MSPVPAEGIGQVYLSVGSLESEQWNFTFDVAFSEPGPTGFVLPLALIIGFGIGLALVAVPIALLVITLRRGRPPRQGPVPPKV